MTHEERINNLIDALAKLGIIELTADDLPEKSDFISPNEYVSIEEISHNFPTQ